MKPQWTVLLAALLLTAGCATAPAPAKPAIKPAIEATAERPLMLGKFERRLADGRLFLAANLKNASAAVEHAQVACDFRDGGGQPVLPAPAPLSVSLEPGEILTVHFEAATIAASEGIVSVRP